MNEIDRRTLLLGSAGLVLAGCSGGSEPEKPKGPNIVKPRTGNVVRPADTAELRDRLNQAFKSHDVDQLVKIIDPEDFAIEDVRARWTRRFDNFDRLNFIDGEWYVGLPGGRTRNASGGAVEYDGDLVFAHTVAGCDAQQVVESYSASFRKKSKDAPLELLHLGDAEASFDPSIWDVAKVDMIETKHAWIVFREKDAAKARANASRIEAGAARAFDLMPRPKGVNKIFYALTWPAVDGKLYGGVAVGDALAHAYYHPFLDPKVLSTGQRKPTGAKGLPKATGRVGLHESSFKQGDIDQTACHEAIHVLANQWYVAGDLPTWIAEGLATWGEFGPRLKAERGRMRPAFAQFEKVVPKGYKEFHDSSLEYEFYLSSAAMFAAIEERDGRDGVFKVAQAFYGSETRQEAVKKIGRTEKQLVADARKWVGA
ncbi:MAG: hypothetical protein ABIN55_03755 [Aeromicrobium sp.]